MINNFLGLVRFSHTLFALPFALSSMILAAEGFPGFKTTILVIFAVIFCRNAAMAFNRLVDEKFDSQNPRTRGRHLPSGILSRGQVIAFIVINSILFTIAAFLLNEMAFILSFPTLGVVFFYSIAKRFTWLCHFFLGLALSISPMGAWVAVTGQISPLSAVLGLALFLWVSGFDMIYATQDIEIDKTLSLNSIPVRLGINNSLWIAKILHFLMLFLLIYLGFKWYPGLYYLISIFGVFLCLVYIHFFRRTSSLDKMNNDFFLANALISCLIFTGVVLSVYFS